MHKAALISELEPAAESAADSDDGEVRCAAIVLRAVVLALNEGTVDKLAATVLKHATVQ